MNNQAYYFNPQQRIQREETSEEESDGSGSSSVYSSSGSESESCSSGTGSYSGSQTSSGSSGEDSGSGSESDSSGEDSGSESGSESEYSSESEEEEPPKTKRGKSKKETKVPKKEPKKETKKETKVPKKEAKVPKKETKVPKKEPKKETKVPKKEAKVPKKEAKVPKKEARAPKKEAKKETKKESKSHRRDKPRDESEYEDEFSSGEEGSVQSEPSMSPGQYIFGVISNVIESNDKKAFKGILSRTPVPIVLHYFHHITQKAMSMKNEGMDKVVVSINKKYNIISDVYMDAFRKGEPGMIGMVMDYFSQTVEAFKTAPRIETKELLKHFTPEFIAMNIIQSGNIDSYDSVISQFKKDDMAFSRGFHAAKPLVASYFGIKSFFSNQKRYTFNREILVLAICGGDTDTLDYIVKKSKSKGVTDDVVLEARSCHPISSDMVDHLRYVYNVRKN